MEPIEYITDLILKGETAQARAEIQACSEYSRIYGKPSPISALQSRDLIEACDYEELTK